jgi:hypothetical protein
MLRAREDIEYLFVLLHLRDIRTIFVFLTTLHVAWNCAMADEQ